jgi:hypothetical protein
MTGVFDAMKRISSALFLLVLSGSLVSFVARRFDAHQYPEEIQAEPNRFVAGEHLEYRVHYGFINAAEAVVDVSPKLHRVNNRPCYRVNVTGRTTGALDVFTRVRDTWQSYVDTQTLQPQEFYMRQQEGKYRKEQRATFDHDTDQVITNTNGTETKQLRTPPNVHDVISGYYYLRTVDFSRMQPGQVVGVKAYFDNEFYDMRVKYLGREVVSTKFGKINAFKIIPQMPKNELFDGKESIRMWVSDDENRIPIKAEVDLVVGAIALDLKNFKGLKVQPRWL